MPRFSQRSLSRLHTCHEDLVRLMLEVVQHVDITVLEGHRGREAQEEAWRTGRSQLLYPQSLHNRLPALAVDIAPWRPRSPHVDWEDRELWRAVGGFVLGVASQLGIEVRWGGDWSMDWEFKGQALVDLPHFELVVKKE